MSLPTHHSYECAIDLLGGVTQRSSVLSMQSWEEGDEWKHPGCPVCRDHPSFPFYCQCWILWKIRITFRSVKGKNRKQNFNTPSGHYEYLVMSARESCGCSIINCLVCQENMNFTRPQCRSLGLLFHLGRLRWIQKRSMQFWTGLRLLTWNNSGICYPQPPFK